VLTKCPNCASCFEVDLAPGTRVGVCPTCNQAASFRSLDSLKQIESEWRRRIKEDLISGGPSENCVKLCGLLEDVRSLWNVGSIFRTSDAAGFRHLYLCGITGCPPRKEIAKTSLGAEHYVSWHYHMSSFEIARNLKEQGVMMVALEYTQESNSLYEVISKAALTIPMCLVVGNEDRGISAEMLSLCDYVCHLPMSGVKTSLNVAVAYGIASYRIAEHFCDAKSQVGSTDILTI
jgi:tRNA G18 (ribose-2'-O)-methylase SpoU